MKGKIIAKVKPDKLDVEKTDQWMSYDGELMKDFRARMSEGGSNGDNYDYTDPIHEPVTSAEPATPYAGDILIDLSIAYFAKQLGLLDSELENRLKSLKQKVSNHFEQLKLISISSEDASSAEGEHKEKQQLQQEVKENEDNTESQAEIEKAKPPAAIEDGQV